MRKGIPPSLDVEATKEFVGAAPLLKDILPKGSKTFDSSSVKSQAECHRDA